MTFEETMAELEKTVAELESGNVTLDRSVELFEKGVRLSIECRKMLDNAEKKVSVLLSDESGEKSEAPFDGDM